MIHIMVIIGNQSIFAGTHMYSGTMAYQNEMVSFQLTTKRK